MLLPFKNLPRFLILLKINYELFPISWKAPYNQTPAYLSALIYYHCPLYSVPQRHTSVCTTLNMPRLTTGPLHLLCHWPVWFCLRFSTGFLTPIHRFSKSFPPQREKKMATHSSILSWRIHGWRSLVGYRPRGRKESDMTSFSFSLSLHPQNLYLPSAVRRFQWEVVRTRICRLQSVRT